MKGVEIFKDVQHVHHIFINRTVFRLVLQRITMVKDDGGGCTMVKDDGGDCWFRENRGECTKLPTQLLKRFFTGALRKYIYVTDLYTNI